MANKITKKTIPTDVIKTRGALAIKNALANLKKPSKGIPKMK